MLIVPLIGLEVAVSRTIAFLMALELQARDGVDRVTAYTQLAKMLHRMCPSYVPYWMWFMFWPAGRVCAAVCDALDAANG